MSCTRPSVSQSASVHDAMKCVTRWDMLPTPRSEQVGKATGNDAW